MALSKAAARSRVSLSGALLCAAAIIIAGIALYRSTHAAPAVIIVAEPSVVVSIDLQRMLNELDEMEDLRAAWDAKAQAIVDHRTEKKAEIDSLQQGLDALDGEARLEQASQAFMAVGQLDAWVSVKGELLQRERRDGFIAMYDNILEAAAAIAESNGYDYVLLSDTNLRPLPQGRAEDAAAQMFARHIIYAAPGRDVTDDLLVRMNNAYTQGE